MRACCGVCGCSEHACTAHSCGGRDRCRWFREQSDRCAQTTGPRTVLTSRRERNQVLIAPRHPAEIPRTIVTAPALHPAHVRGGARRVERLRCSLVRDAAWHHAAGTSCSRPNSVRDTEEAVRSRMKRQEWLHRPGKRLHVPMWEAALRTLICPPQVLAAQLDRLAGVIGMDTVDLGIVPLHAAVKVPPADGFWSFDGRLVVTEDWDAELWLDDADTIATYQRVWQALSESAVFGAEAQHVIAQARRSLDVR
nr:Scr1 family TA system antitoxin-like transcriptional regulator [Streptomyces atratus]